MTNPSRNRHEFTNHESIIKKLYGSPDDDFFTFIISQELNIRLINYLNERHKSENAESQMAHFNKKSLHLETTNTVPDEFKVLTKFTYKWMPLPPSDGIVKELEDHVRVKIQKYVKSPFAYVNAKSWITKPSTKIFYGPNKLHRDGFADGHLKIMIYPNGLNKDNGGIAFKGHGSFLDIPKGGAVCFKNSDVKHAGIPGTKHDRLCVELTIQRTLVSCNHNNESHCDGRHLEDPWIAYKLQEEKNEINPLIKNLM